MLTSYAQNFEDVMLMRALKHVENGVYIDIGAHDPVQDSVSLAFYKQGWRGIHVEPVPEFAARLEAARPDERVLRAVIRNGRDPIMFYSVTDTGMSTGDAAIAAQHLKAGFAISTLLAESIPLSEVLDSASSHDVHWLKIDVEGMERVVLESWGDSKVRPWIVVIESTKPNSTETTHQDWERLIERLGYEFVYFDGLNRFYVSAEHPELKAAFGIPPNYFDDFSVTEHSIFARAPQARLLELEIEQRRAEHLDRHLEALDSQILGLNDLLEGKDRQIGALDNKVLKLNNQIEGKDLQIKDGELQLKNREIQLKNRDLQLKDMEFKIKNKDLQSQDMIRNLAAVEERLTVLQAMERQLDARNQELRRALDVTQQNNQDHHDRWQAAERTIIEIRTSHSWKLTAPIRRGVTIIRYALKGLGAWVLLKPGCRPRRTARLLISMFSSSSAPAHSAAQAPSSAPAIVEGNQVRFLFVDHTIACSTNTGVQRVVRGLSKAFLQSGLVVRFVKWDPALGACVLINSEERDYLARWNGPHLSESEGGVYPPKGAPAMPVTVGPESHGRLIVPEVTHISFQPEAITGNLIAWARAAGLKTGFVFYDAIPLMRPEFAAIAPVHAQYMRDLRMADAVWPISRWSADELASFWGAAQDADNSYLPSIHPIHLPAEFGRPRVTGVKPGQKLILCVGTVETRKNQTALIKAFQAILSDRPDCGWRLVLAGNLHPAVAAEVRAATGPGSSIEFRGHVSDSELSDLYERCSFTVFPSIAEGFGLPILESLWSGKPCICANFGAMGEVAVGGGCLTADVRDEAVLNSAVERLMDDADLRRVLSEEAVLRPIGSWADYLLDLEAAAAGGQSLIYYWVDVTIGTPFNSGIQRVARQLARELIEAGFQLVPVKWGGQQSPFHPVSAEELAHFARWNGPAVDRWREWVAPNANSGGCWFVMTELPLNLTDGEQKMVRGVAEAAHMKTAAVFYDTIPWKLRDIYPKAFADAHRAYIGEVANYSKVLSISEYSRGEMISVMAEEFGVPVSRLSNIVVCPLAGEFPEESKQTNQAVPRADGAIEILCVGTVEPRKNHERLLEAFELACAKSPRPLHLTIVGRSTELGLSSVLRARADSDPRLDWEEKADDARVQQLYAECDFTIYPSVEEGFGLPILESLWYGKPCVCANFGSMQEVAAEGGGCVAVDVRDVAEMADAICDLANSPLRLQQLVEEANDRTFRLWSDYTRDVAAMLGLWTYPTAEDMRENRQAMGLSTRPRLSVCISTYNRAEWLSAALRNIAQLYPEPCDGVEFVICDNASTDHTPEVVRPFLARADFTYRRNLANVGMLGNLRETARAASGEYIWILGDDDLLLPGAVERVLQAISANPNVSLVYLNYAFTRIDDARTVTDFDRFFAEATPIVPPEGDLTGPIREICARNENFFTAIYTLVFRRDHALSAYSQDTSGRPFSTMLTCIPTTFYVLNNMMDEPGVWIGEPQVVVNMNVSWMRYAPLWILERIPEVYETARSKGVAAEDVDRWRRHTLPGVAHFFAEIFADDPLGNAAYFHPARLIGRFSDLPEFGDHRSKMMDIYSRAHASGHPAASESQETVFGGMNEPSEGAIEIA